MKHKVTKYLKESCIYSSDEQFFFKYFLNVSFVKEMLQRLPGSFGCFWHEWVKLMSDEGHARDFCVGGFFMWGFNLTFSSHDFHLGVDLH